MGEVCVLFVTLLYAPGASSAQSDAAASVQPSDSEYLDCPPLVTTRLLNRNVNQPTNQLPQIHGALRACSNTPSPPGTTHQRFRTPKSQLRHKMDAAAEDSMLNQEQRRAPEFALSSTTKPLQLLSMATPTPSTFDDEFNATSGRSCGCFLPSGVALPITHVPVV